MLNEADTCRIYVTKSLYATGWTDDQIREQYFFTNGRITGADGMERRGERNKADYLLGLHRGLPMAVVEAKASYKKSSDGLGQAKDYATTLGVLFAYSTNGTGIVEFDQTTGITSDLSSFPSPETLWKRIRQHQGHEDERSVEPLLQPDNLQNDREPRYYQRIAINRTVEAIAKGRKRVLVTLATGTGKTDVAFQVCWKLSTARWTRIGARREPKILFLADRDVLVSEPMARAFAPFGEARHRIYSNHTSRARSMYFATYQALAGDESRPPLYEKFPRDFFDLVVVDECHRGSASEDSQWRQILEYFHPAVQLGLTATPIRDNYKDSYEYFGNPIYIYSLRDGINDGFLAPYRVHRIITSVDAAGWRPERGQVDRGGNEIPDDLYGTPDFERKIALTQRTRQIAKHLVRFMHETDPMAKTIIFCVDQEHASHMAKEIGNLNRQVMMTHPDYVVRVTADEGDIGRGHLSNFQDIERTTPVILTTSQLLTTGVDAPTCKNIVIARMVGSMVEFKQIIGRGTRVREDYGKLSFNILDFTGSATVHFADPEFDGEPEMISETHLDVNGDPIETITLDPEQSVGLEPAEDLEPFEGGYTGPLEPDGQAINERPRKYYVDGGLVEILTHLVYDLDPDGNVLRCIKLTDYTGERVRSLVSSPEELQAAWMDPVKRHLVLDHLSGTGLTPESIAKAAQQPDVDTFDLLCNLAFNIPVRTRKERATRVVKEEQAFFDEYSPLARQILGEVLEKYTEHGVTELQLPDVLKVEPISRHGNVREIIAEFGDTVKLRNAIIRLQQHIYEEPAA